jgi:F-type H+-transporting ATPase subunit gamma
VSNTLQDLNRRIAGAGDLQGVVRSMKALAASSIGQYEKAVASLEDYYRTVELGLAACLRREELPFTKISPRHDRPIGAIIFGSDQGLVGRFNEVVAEFALGKLASMPGKKKLWPVGDRVRELVTDTGLPQGELLTVPTSIDAITPFVGQLIIKIEAARERGDMEEVHLFHNHPKPGSLYEPMGRRLLPLDQAWRHKVASLPWPTKTLPEVMGELTGQLESFVRSFLFVTVFQACAESLASENASRLAAMQRAEKNIETILDDLNRTFHRIRQESIDEELSDVIAGFKALKTRS